MIILIMRVRLRQEAELIQTTTLPHALNLSFNVMLHCYIALCSVYITLHYISMCFATLYCMHLVTLQSKLQWKSANCSEVSISCNMCEK